MNKYYFNERYSVKVQKQRCHLIEVNMSTVAILVPSLVFFSFCSCCSLFLFIFFFFARLFTSRLWRGCMVRRKKNWDVSKNRLVSECVVRSFFSCAFFPLAMSLFDMLVVHEVCYWWSSEKKSRAWARDLRCLDAPSFNASDFLFL